jgi:TolB-like protein
VHAFAPPNAIRDPPRRDGDAGGAPIRLAEEARLRLGALTIEPALRRVAYDGGGAEIVEPRVMQVLVALVRAEGRILSRDELLASCWHGVVVGEDAITRVMGRLRRLVDGVGEGSFRLETITKVGYRLVPTRGVAEAPRRDAPKLASAAEPRLAVLAFDTLCDGEDFAWFSTGVSEEILQMVASGVALEVIGRGSSFQFRGAEKSASHVAAALNVTHLLDGSVRRRGPTVRISAQLIECAGETALWSDRFDRDLSDYLAVQDEIARAVAAALATVFAPRQPWRAMRTGVR